MENLLRLRNAFNNALNLDGKEITDDFCYGRPGWDSIAHMALIASIENEFDIMMDTTDVIDLSSFGKAKTILYKYEIQF